MWHCCSCLRKTSADKLGFGLGTTPLIDIRNKYFNSTIMNPKIDNTEFGSITIGGEVIEHDVIIHLSGNIEKRKKKLSKAVFGTSHIISLEEAKYIYEKGAEQLIIGAGQSGMVSLSNEASEYFKRKQVQVDLSPTPEAIKRWNMTKGSVIGLFHVTC